MVQPGTSTKPSSARDRLLAAADELFYAEGVHVVGIDRVVERAGVAKASLYTIFGSKDDLVRAYLEKHFRLRQRRIAAVLAANEKPRERLLGVFGEIEDALEGSDWRGCRFLSASAEAQPGDASEIIAEEYRAWLRSLFADLSEAAGAESGRQLHARWLSVDLIDRGSGIQKGSVPILQPVGGIADIAADFELDMRVNGAKVALLQNAGRWWPRNVLR